MPANRPTTEAKWDERSRKYYSNLEPQPSEEFFQQAKEWEIKHGCRLSKFTDQELVLWEGSRKRVVSCARHPDPRCQGQVDFERNSRVRLWHP